MKRGKDSAGEQRSTHRMASCRKEAIGHVGIQPHLLQKTEGHVPEEVLRDKEMAGGAMQPTEEEPSDAKSKD